MQLCTRVISLLESLPDIDPSLGIDVHPSTMNGELILKDVNFYYQMRPDNNVLYLVLLYICMYTIVCWRIGID